jgi:hypothetical protein
MSEDIPDLPAQEAQAPMFRVNGQPVVLPDEFAKALAQIVVEWSRLESAIASDTTSTMNMLPALADMATEAPRSFKKKLDLWSKVTKRAFGSIPQYCQVVDHIVPRARTAALIRNHLIHGHWPISGVGPTGEYQIHNFEGLKQGRLTRMTVTQDVLDEVLAEILDLAGTVYGFTMTRMLHAHHGLLRAQPAPAPEDQTRPNPPTETKP